VKAVSWLAPVKVALEDVTVVCGGFVLEAVFNLGWLHGDLGGVAGTVLVCHHQD